MSLPAALAALGGLVLVYWVGPDLLGHFAQWGALAGDIKDAKLALTFDDGPGPDTAAVLDVLKEFGVRATFFVVAEEARARPEMVRRLVAEGHEVGLHGWHHRSAWITSPWGAAREILRGRALVEGITGQPVRWYRPPWGHHNLVTWVLPGLVGLKRVLWSVAPDDWRTDRSPEVIARHVVRYANPGAIVVLHDAGGDRRRTVAALPAIIQGVRALALDPVPVGELTAERSWFRRAWIWWENQFTRTAEIDTVPASDGGPPLVRLGRATYRGPVLTLDDGRVIRPGAVLAEIHFQNPTLGSQSELRTGALAAYARMLGGLSDAARVVATDPRFQEAELVGGVTVLDAATAIHRLGFERVPVGGFRMFWMRLYLILLMAIYHSEGVRVLRRMGRLKPVLIYMTRDRFLARYGPDARGLRRR
jgi:peptidoglycan/xylan/chitin deacetylase (PgdA/CDA1 family)